MRGILLAWVAGLGILTVREIQAYRKPVVPGRYLGASGVFAALALLAEWDRARTPAILAAVAFDVAVFFQAGPARLVNAITPSSSSGRSGPAGAPAAQPGKTQGPTGG